MRRVVALYAEVTRALHAGLIRPTYQPILEASPSEGWRVGLPNGSLQQASGLVHPLAQHGPSPATSNCLWPFAETLR